MDSVSIIYAEKQFLGYILKHPQIIDATRVSFFKTDTAQAIFSAVKHLHEEGVTLNPASVKLQLSQANKQVKSDVIDSLFTLEVPDRDFFYFKKAIQKAGIQLDLQQEILPDLINITSAKSEFDPEAIRNLIARSNQLLNTEAEEVTVYDGVSAVERYQSILEDRRSGAYFFSSGDSYLDSRLTVGFAPGTQTVIFGTTGSGKTSFALSLFLKMIHKKIPCIYISLEMPMDMLLDRLFASKYQIPLNWLYPQANESETIPDWVFDKLALFRIEMQKAKHFRILDEAVFSINELEETISDIKKEMNVSHLNVFIDLTTMLQDFSISEGGGSRADVIEVGVNRLNALAKKLQCHIINIVQSNRQQDNTRLNKLEDIDKLFPTLNHIKSSNAIAERARLVLGVFRKKYYAERYFPNEVETETMDDIMQVSILKQSQGALGELTYLFAGELASVYKFDLSPNLVRREHAPAKEESSDEEKNNTTQSDNLS